MGWIARSPLATAASRAGGVGIIGTSSGETANGLSEITQMVASDLPFGVKLPIRFLKDDAMLRFGCEAGIRFITTSAASPANFIAPLKAADTQPLHQTGLLAADAFAGIQQVCFGGEVNAAPALAGQSAGLIHGVKSVQAIIDQTVAQFFDSTGRLAVLAALAAARHF